MKNKVLILDLILTRNGCTIPELSAATSFKWTTIDKHIRELTSEKLVVRAATKRDGNAVYIKKYNLPDTSEIHTHPMIKERYLLGKELYAIKQKRKKENETSFAGSNRERVNNERLVKIYLLHNEINEIYHFHGEECHLLPKNDYQAANFASIWFNFHPTNRLLFMLLYMKEAKIKKRSLVVSELKLLESDFWIRMSKGGNYAHGL